MALTNKPKRILTAYLEGKVAIPVRHGVEKATQTYKKGAPLIDDDAGRLTEATSPIDASAVAKRCLGFALNDATGVTGADAPIALVGENEVFEGTLSNSTAGTHTLAQGDQWQTFPLTKDPTFATGIWYLDRNAVSDTGGAIVIGFKDPIGTVDARVYFIITTPARGGANAGSANM